MLAKVQSEYNERLKALKTEKEAIKQQTESFHVNLVALQD